MTDSVALAGHMVPLKLVAMGMWQRVVANLRRLKCSDPKGKYLTSFEVLPAGRKDEFCCCL